MNGNYLNGIGTRTTWVLLAHRAGAKLYVTHRGVEDLKLLEEFDYPQGRKQNQEIDTDAKGSRYSTTAGRGAGRAGYTPSHQMKHGFDPQLEAAEHVADVFAHNLAKHLHDCRARQEFDELILVAEPGFLGKVRRFLDKETSKQISGSLNRNLTDLPEKELIEHLRPVLLGHKKVA